MKGSFTNPIKTSGASAQQVYVLCDSCGEDNTQSLYRLINTHIVKCQSCGLMYVNPRVNSKILQKKVELWAAEDAVDDVRLATAFDAQTIALYQQYLTWIKRFCGSFDGKHLLDVGCSVGAFLSTAQKSGCVVQGVELGRESARYVRDNLPVDVLQTSIFDADIAADSLDIVTLMEVIEHLESPCDAVNLIHSWLKPSGLLFLTTPNFNSLYRRLHGNKWWVINCEEEHIFFFDFKNLTRILETAGFEVVFRYNRGYDFAGMLRQFKHRSNRSLKFSSAESFDDYYDARDGKAVLKAKLSAWKLDRLARLGFDGLNYLSSQRWSPLWRCADQLIVIARKR